MEKKMYRLYTRDQYAIPVSVIDLESVIDTLEDILYERDANYTKDERMKEVEEFKNKYL